MKKLLNISVIAALAILPFAANATPVAGEPAHADPATAASAVPGYALAEAESHDGNLATAGYVKGAYNAAIKAINKVATTAGSAVQSVTEGTTNGTIAVDGTDVAVHGLGSAAYEATTAFEAAGAVNTAIGALDATQTQAAGADGLALSITEADGVITAISGSIAANTYDAYGAASGVQTAIEDKLNDGATGYDIDAKTLKVQGADVLTGASLTDYAKKTGVTQTITDSTITGTVPVVATWGSDTETTVAIAASITGATYAEPANP